MEYQRVTYEQLVESQGRQDELAHQFLDWAQRFRGQPDCFHLLMEAYTRLFDEQSGSKSALEFDIVGAAGHPLSLAKLARQTGLSSKTPAAFHELEAFLLAKKLEAQVILGQPTEEVEATWREWGELIHHCEESPELRAITATVLRNMALCYGVHQQPHLANTHYEALMDLSGRHALEPAILQEWSKASVELSEIYATQKDPRRCRQLYDDLMDALPHCEEFPWLRANLARTARNVVWAYREHPQFDRPATLTREVRALCERFPDDKVLRREMARLWVSLSYGYGHRRQWRKCLPLFCTISEWMARYPNDRHLRLRWMQVGRNLVWGHDGHEGLRDVEQVYEAMAAMQQKYPHQTALRTELGWSCVNMSWSYGCERGRLASGSSPSRSSRPFGPGRKPAPVERVVEVSRSLQAAHTIDVELAECFAATCRNWLWSLRDESGSQPLQAKVVEELRQLMARFPKEAYIRKQAVACLVNYSYVAKQRNDASLLMKDLEWVQRLWMEHSTEDYLPQALSELASNLIETYEHATSPEEAKSYLALIAGLSTEKPQDPVILSSLGCATSETAWLCERLGDLAGSEQCHQLIESYCDRHPDNAELQKSMISCTLAWLSCLCQKGQLERAFEIHLRVRYQARRNPGNPFFQFCWGRSCELLIVSHPHHQMAGPLLPLLVAELGQIKSEMPEDPTIWEFWVNSRLHLIWRSLAERDLDAAEDEVVRLSQQISQHPAADELMPYQQKLLLVSVWIAAQQENWSGLRTLLGAMMNNLRRHPHWVLMAQTLAQAGVVAMLAYGRTDDLATPATHSPTNQPTPETPRSPSIDGPMRAREATLLLGRLYRLFNGIKDVYVSVEDSVAVWDQFARVALVWQATLGSRPLPTGWRGFWQRRQQNRALALVRKAIRQAESQTVLWSWVTWILKPAGPSDPAHPVVTPATDGAHRPEAIARRLTNLMQVLTIQHPHDEVLGGIYRDWLSLVYVTQLSLGQAESARQSWQLMRKAAGQPQGFRLKTG